MNSWMVGGLFVISSLAFWVGGLRGYNKGHRIGYRLGWQRRAKFGPDGAWEAEYRRPRRLKR